MTVRPTLFATPMVCAILEDRKTQTRRVLVPQPTMKPGVNPDFSQFRAFPHGRDHWCLHGSNEASEPFEIRYAAGDLLWVREAWRTPESLDGLSPRQIAERCEELGYRGPWCPRVTEADNLTHQWCEEDGFRDDEPAGRLRAARHMPRWASRLTLKVTNVRVQRVQAISDQDAMAEGVEVAVAPVAGRDIDIDGDYWPGGPRRMFKTLWNGLNEARGFGWETNPWVVAVTFSAIKANVDKVLEDEARAA
ncbi:MAG: hypothetical protein JJ902_05650 [Roseibium sp.]|nr:hypothetical protein [Roseibium sp.]